MVIYIWWVLGGTGKNYSITGYDSVFDIFFSTKPGQLIWFYSPFAGASSYREPPVPLPPPTIVFSGVCFATVTEFLPTFIWLLCLVAN